MTKNIVDPINNTDNELTISALSSITAVGLRVFNKVVPNTHKLSKDIRGIASTIALGSVLTKAIFINVNSDERQYRNNQILNSIIFTSLGAGLASIPWDIISPNGLLYNFVKNFSHRSYEDSDQESKRTKIHEEIKSRHLRSTEESKQKYLSTITNPQGELLQNLEYQKR